MGHLYDAWYEHVDGAKNLWLLPKDANQQSLNDGWDHGHKQSANDTEYKHKSRDSPFEGSA